MTSIAIGEAAPPFELPDTEGATHALAGDGEAAAPATVVVFTCNHCPYALAWHDRLLAVARDYADEGVRMLMINSNDADRYPRDSFDAMRERVRADGGWPAAYLRDEDQEVARAYGALTTPDVFVVAPDGAIAYRGAPDADSRPRRRVAARGARRRPRRQPGAAGRDQAGRLLDQVAPVGRRPRR
jgi:peroxiredoxin